MSSPRIIISNSNHNCNICGRYAKKLSEDHVPPKCTGNNGQTIMYAYSDDSISPLRRNKGVTYQTICRDCNNLLGHSYDNEFGKFCKYIKAIIESPLTYPYPHTLIEINPLKLAKSILGHLLATMVNHTLLNNKYNENIQNFILGKEDLLPCIKIYYWVFPYKTYISANNIIGHSMANITNNNLYHILKLYPIAFAIIYETKPCNARYLLNELTQYFNNTTSVKLNLPTEPFPYNFPEKAQDFCNLRQDNHNDTISFKP